MEEGEPVTYSGAVFSAEGIESVKTRVRSVLGVHVCVCVRNHKEVRVASQK